MSDSSNHFAHTAMLIRRPVSEVYDAFINPAVTSRFWFSEGSAKLEPNQTVQWTWEMYNHTVSVHVLDLIVDKKILIQWGDDKESTVEWEFKSIDDAKTFVSITNRGFKGTNDELINQIRDSTGGFTWVLAGLKALLEHGIELNLVGDRFPKE